MGGVSVTITMGFGTQMEHPRVSCDRSGESPLKGTRWVCCRDPRAARGRHTHDSFHRYKMIGQNYDLCAAEFAKLSVAEQAKYVAMTMPQASAEDFNGQKGNPELKA